MKLLELARLRGQGDTFTTTESRLVAIVSAILLGLSVSRWGRGYRLRGGSREASRMLGIIHGESDLLAIGDLERVPVGILDQGPIAHGGAGVFRAK